LENIVIDTPMFVVNLYLNRDRLSTVAIVQAFFQAFIVIYSFR